MSDDFSTLKLFKFSMILAGTWPSKLIKSRFLRILYRVLSFINRWFFVMFMVFMYMEIPAALNEGLLLENLSLSIIYTVAIAKMFICKSQKIRKLLYVILKSEEELKETQDKGKRKIFEKYVKKRNLISKGFFYICTCVLNTFIITHFNEEVLKWDGITEIDGKSIKRRLPYVSYFPLNRNEHYTIGFLFHSIIAYQAGFFYVVAQLFILTFEIHICTRLECLQHVLMNIEEYSKELMEKCGSGKKALQCSLYFCVREHQEIIRFLNELNQSLKMLMLMDFLTSSIQLASMLISVIMNDHQNSIMYFGLICMLMMIYQIVSLYYFANEIKIQSVNVSRAAYATKWFFYPPKIAKRIHIMIMFSNKPLALYIGPFGEMSLEKAVSIFKTAYSFTAFMYR